MLNLSERYWRDIEGYEGLYQVHREGYVRNSHGRILKPHVINTGYQALALSGRGKPKHFLLHRLVALAWVRNRKPEYYLIVNHKDGVKLNCRWTNLQWCNNSMNILHARRTGLNPYNKPTVGKKFGNSSKYHGVTYDASRDRWRAYVRHDNKYLHQKRFDTEEEAARHYNWIVRTCKLDRPLNAFESKCVTTIERKPKCLTAADRINHLDTLLSRELARDLAMELRASK